MENSIDMQVSCTAEAAPKAGKARLLTLDDLDSRTRAAKQARALVTAIEDDLGGSDRLSAGERQLVQRVAILGALLESFEAQWLAGGELDLTAYLPAANCQRRLAESVGLRRQPRDVTSLRDSLIRESRNGA